MKTTSSNRTGTTSWVTIFLAALFGGVLGSAITAALHMTLVLPAFSTDALGGGTKPSEVRAQRQGAEIIFAAQQDANTARDVVRYGDRIRLRSPAYGQLTVGKKIGVGRSNAVVSNAGGVWRISK